MGTKSRRRLLLIAGGIGLGLASYVLVKRTLTGIVERLHSPKPDLCKGFASERVRCLNLGITTVYLLEGESGYLMIDTSYPHDYDKFLDGLARLGVGLDEIKALLLTHGHDDHAGFAARLLEETDARLIAHRRALPLLRGEQMTHQGIRFLNARVFVLATLYMLVTRRNFGYPPVAPRDDDIILAGDDDRVLRNLGFDADVIATPGHTDGSISVMTSEGEVFCGDAVMSFLPVTGAQLRPIFISDEEQVFASWRKILADGAEVIYPAHGEPVWAEQLAASLHTFRPQ